MNRCTCSRLSALFFFMSILEVFVALQWFYQDIDRLLEREWNVVVDFVDARVA